MPFAIACFLIALMSQAVFGLFVFALGWNYLLPRPVLPMPWPWVVNVGWIVVLALQHSGMARRGVKDWFAGFFPVHLYRALYVGLSGLLTLGLALTWQPLPGEPLWEGPRWISAIALFGLLGIIGCSFVFDGQEFFGLKQAATGKVERDETLLIVGPYRFVRHPLMLALLVFLWGHASMPATLAFLSAGLTIYVLLAVPLEERDLVRTFGVEYERYRQRVPALIPYRWPAKREVVERNAVRR